MKTRWFQGISKVTALVLALGLCMALAAPAQAQIGPSFKFWAQIVDENDEPIASGLTCNVYDTTTDTATTVYSDPALATARSQGWAADSQGQCIWYNAASTAVDLIVWHKRGKVRYTGLATTGPHKLVLNKQVPGKVLAIPFIKKTSEFDTGVTIPKGAFVRGILINDTTTAGVSGAASSPYPWIRVGILSTETGGDADGFCGSGITVVNDDTTGGRVLGQGKAWLGCHAVVSSWTISSAASGGWDFYYSAFHSGALLSRGRAGNHASGATGHAGVYTFYGYRGDGVAKTVSYTTSNDTVTGTIFILMDELGNDTSN